MPLWLVAGHKELLGEPQAATDAEVTSGLLETAVRLLGTAGTAVRAVDIVPASDDVPELRSDTVTARVGLATATGTRPVTVSAEYGLALAAVAGAPVRVADAVMDRLAVSVPGEAACWRCSCLRRTPGREVACRYSGPSALPPVPACLVTLDRSGAPGSAAVVISNS